MRTHEIPREKWCKKFTERGDHFVVGDREEQTLSGVIQREFDKLRENMQNETRPILLLYFTPLNEFLLVLRGVLCGSIYELFSRLSS
jgi:hypothetical protein